MKVRSRPYRSILTAPVWPKVCMKRTCVCLPQTQGMTTWRYSVIAGWRGRRVLGSLRAALTAIEVVQSPADLFGRAFFYARWSLTLRSVLLRFNVVGMNIFGKQVIAASSEWLHPSWSGRGCCDSDVFDPFLQCWPAKSQSTFLKSMRGDRSSRPGLRSSRYLTRLKPLVPSSSVLEWIRRAA